jgi:hypothetical protein
LGDSFVKRVVKAAERTIVSLSSAVVMQGTARRQILQDWRLLTAIAQDVEQAH